MPDAAAPPSRTSPSRVTAKRLVSAIGCSTRLDVSASTRSGIRRRRSSSRSALRESELEKLNVSGAYDSIVPEAR